MSAHDEIAEFFRQVVIVQSLVHTGRHPDCPREDGKCIYPDCTCALPSPQRQTGGA